MRLLIAVALVAFATFTESVDPCKRQPFRGRCPSLNGEAPKRSQFVLRYYLRNGECVSYPYGHCAQDPSEPTLFRYKEECEDACISNAPANLGAPKDVAPEKVPTTTTATTTTTTTEAVTTETTPEVTTTTEAATTTTTEVPTTTTRASTTTTTTETVVPTTTGPRTECERRRLSSSQSKIQGAFVPVCTINGDFEKVQCEVNGEQCFCVDSHGIEVPNSRSSGKTRPDCNSIQSTKTVSTKECFGAPLAGPCKESVTRFFYNDNSQRCEEFNYSGCGGNGNNYESREACEERCAPPPAGLPKCEVGEPLKTKIGVPVNCAKTDCPSGYRCSVVQHSSVCCPDNNKAVGLQTAGRASSRCALPKQRGPCDKYELRFYFNADLNECKYFFWGGCEGNANNFERVEDCETACGVSQHSRVTNKPNTEIRTTQGIRITPNGRMNWEETEESTTPIGPEAEPTSTLVPPPSSSSTTTTTTTSTTTRRPITTTRASRVHQTTTSVVSEEEEEVSEEEEEQHTIHVQPPVPVQNTVLLGGIEDSSTDSVNRCLHPKDTGTCRGQFVRWFFDAEKKACDVFTYTGCQGNGNNFASQEECLAICHRPEPVTQQPQLPDFKQICSNDVDAGECNGVFERFAFDGETGDCRAFTYGGCGGNGNNFATMQECRQRCTKSSTETRVNICESDIDVGECKGNFQRFAFDKSINDCRKFAYGGCGGNGNNFATLQECTNRCINKVCPETPSCDITRCQLVNDRSGCPFCSCPPVKQPLPPAPKCAPIKKSECEEPCIIFSNRKGCEECVCPQDPTNAPSSSVQPPAPSSFQPGPPASGSRPTRPTEAAPPAPSRQFAANTVEQAKPSELPSLPKHLAEQIQEKCLQPVEPGPCKNFADRWYFNVDDGTCHPFKYGGCAGNRNHFFTQKECEVHCARFLGLNDESDESEEEQVSEVEEPTHGLRRPVAHGVPIQPTVPLVIPTYSSPTPVSRGGSPPGVEEGKIDEEEEKEEDTLERFEAQPPAPSTTIVPRLPKVVSGQKQLHTQTVQGFVVTSTTQTKEVPTTTTTTTTTTEEPSTTEVELSTEPEVSTTEEPRQPIIKEVVETKAKSQTVNLEKFIPRAKPVPQEFENEISSSGEGSGVEFESEPESEEEEEEVVTTTTTTEAPKLKKVEIRPRGFTTTTTTTTTTTSTETPTTTEVSTESPVTEEEAEVTTESVKLTETSTESEIVTEPVSTTTTTTTTTSKAPITTTTETATTTTTGAPSTTTTQKVITTTDTVESEFSFNSDEMDENTELVETPDNIRAAGSKTLEAAKAVETKKVEKADNGVSRLVEEIDIDRNPEIIQILSTTSSTPVFEPKFDGRVVCAMPPDAGTCTSYIPRWFFNSQTGQCEQFAYGSCGGNDNNFVDRQTCERRCMPHHVILAQVPDRCSYEKDSGNGRGYNVKWYFNMKNLRCEQFVFEGLGGNSNQFETLSECERICTPASQRASGPLPSEVQHPTPSVIHPEVSDEEYDDDENDSMVLPERVSEHFRIPSIHVPTVVDAELVTQTVPLPETTVVTTTTTAPRVVVTSTAFAPTVAPTHQPSNRIIPQESLPIVPVLQTVPLPPVPEVTTTTTQTSTTSTTTTTTQAPSTEPRPPAAHAAKTVFPEEKPTYKAEPVLGREQLPTANDGQPIVGTSPKETVNYQTGEVVAKASGIRSFNADENKISATVFNTKSTSASGLPACANGRQEVTYADGRPVMCLPGKNQCPEKSSCYFNGIDFACCPDEEDPYDKHVFGGYNGEETKNGYKVFGGLNIRRLMDEVPLRQKRQSAFNIDSVVAPLRFDAEKPRQVHRALHMRQQQQPVPRHGANPLCVQPVVKGSCQEAHLRYFYDKMSDSCRLFEYSGCDGNANNFGSLEDCQRLCVLDIKTIQNARVPTTTVDPIVSVQEDEKLAPGQCPGGRSPLGGSSPVLCGNTTESIGCPTSYYCRRGPPDVCCPGTDPKLLQQPEDIVKDRVRGVVKNESHMPRGFNRQIFLSTPKYMCPDAADPLMLEDGEPMLCGSGFDGVKMCPKGYYCAIDSARSSRLCCPMFGDAQRIASEDIFSQRHALVGTTTTTTVQPALAEADVVAEAVAEAEEGDEEDEEEEEGEEFLAHLQMKPNKPKDTVEDLAKSSPIAADTTSEGGVSIDLGADEKPQIDEVSTTTQTIVVQDKSSCQIKPSEGRVCTEAETSTRTNLQYFYSPKDNRCKLFFYRGCGGNMNRFEKKADCEALCL